MFEVRNHLLFKDGQSVPFKATPNIGGKIAPKGVVMHYTAADNAAGSVAWLRDPRAKASAHMVIDQKGGVVQLAPLNVKTWHAGPSKWGAFSMVNGHFIGIEMANCGILKRMADGTFKSADGKVFKASGVVLAAHKNSPGKIEAWDDYPPEQIAASREILAAIVAAYSIKEANIVGHDDVCIPKGRKIDPGSAYPLASVKAAVFGRK